MTTEALERFFECDDEYDARTLAEKYYERRPKAAAELKAIVKRNTELEEYHGFYMGRPIPPGDEELSENGLLRAQLAQAQERLNDADENLLSMVNQYCCRTTRPSGTPETYSHDFMSTGEAAFDYLTEHGLAKWCENGVDICDLQFPSAHQEVKG